MSPLHDTKRNLTWVARRLLTRAWPIVSFSILFSFIEAAALAPALAWLIRQVLDQWGGTAVANFEIAAFLLSPWGLLGLLLLGTLQLTTIHLRLAGLMDVLAGNQPGARSIPRLVRFAPALLELGLRQVAFYALLAVPFGAAIAGVYALFWAPHDLYRLVKTHPPAFWYGAIGAVIIAAAYVLIAGRRYLRWLFSVPALFFEREGSARAALRSSVNRTKGRLGSLAALVLACGLIAGVCLTLLLSIVTAGNGWILDRIGPSIDKAIPATAALLAVDVLIVSVLGAVVAAAYAGVILARYRELGGTTEPTLIAASQSAQRWWSFAGIVACALLAGLSIAGAWNLLRTAETAEHIEVTAHRGGSKHAPENTVAAITNALTLGAEWAEIDVQLTADGHVVVVHDTDLVRVGGSPLVITRSTLAEIRQVDVGAHFGPEFAGERVPTLAECLDAAGDDLGLNIELKLFRAADAVPLSEAVVAVLEDHESNRKHRVCSQSIPAITRAKELLPGLEIGFIVARAIGDLTSMNVDYLMVESRLATVKLLDRASRLDLPIHVWTVNDPDQLAPLIDRGVANIITGNPAGMIDRRASLNQLDPIERLLLRVRNTVTR